MFVCYVEALGDDQALQQTFGDKINALNAELRLVKQQNDQLETEKYILNQQLEKERSASTPGKIFIL